MSRLSVLLALFLMVCAISLVTSRHQARQLFIDYDRAQGQARDLDQDWRRLQLDRAELVRHARVDRVARESLKMLPIAPDRTLYMMLTPPAIRGELP